jgi:hypothetical protein
MKISAEKKLYNFRVYVVAEDVVDSSAGNVRTGNKPSTQQFQNQEDSVLEEEPGFNPEP